MRILLATDGSEYSEGAARFLRWLNLSGDDEITVLHALYWVPFLYDRESYYETLREIKRDIAPRIIDSALKILKPVKARISTAIIEGAPEECIINSAVESDMDMIVMGARGIKGIKAFFVGSVTRSVAVRSPKPVLITKVPVRERPEGIRVLFATDGSDYSLSTGEFLSGLPFHENAKLTIVNAMPTEFMDIPETFAPEIVEKTIELTDRIREIRLKQSKEIVDRARELLDKRFRKIDVLMQPGDPSAEIVRTAEAIKADLIAVGCRGLRGIRGVMGSVSRSVLMHSACSVLIGKTCRE